MYRRNLPPLLKIAPVSRVTSNTYLLESAVKIDKAGWLWAFVAAYNANPPKPKQ